jgi:UDP-glucose 4-epimerase
MLIEHAQHTRAICEIAARVQSAVVLASSSEVYQWNRDDWMREGDALMIGPSHLPRCGYAISKLNMEHLGLAYWRQRGVPVVVARLFNIVGPRQREGFVLPIFVRAALLGTPLAVHGDGSQIRTFTHVRDAVDALVQLSTTPAAYGEIVNVAAREPCLSIAAVAEKVVHYVGSAYETSGSSPILRVPYDATGDAAWERMRVRRPDVGKLRALTGLAFPDRWDEILQDVCADWAGRLGVRRRVVVGGSVA